jgi:hypothetical protein
MKKKLLYSSLKDDITILVGDSKKVIDKIDAALNKKSYELFTICALDLFNKIDTLSYLNEKKVFYIINSEKLNKDELYCLFDMMIFYKKKIFIQLKNVELISIEKINFSRMSIFSLN